MEDIQWIIVAVGFVWGWYYLYKKVTKKHSDGSCGDCGCAVKEIKKDKCH